MTKALIALCKKAMVDSEISDHVGAKHYITSIEPIITMLLLLGQEEWLRTEWDYEPSNPITLADALAWAITAVENGPPETGQWILRDIDRRTQVIYGNGGYHRYYVANGQISFSAFHATPEGLARAKTFGFTICQ
jgi:hypothetical protein